SALGGDDLDRVIAQWLMRQANIDDVTPTPAGSAVQAGPAALFPERENP
ncbi:MAG: hypothetical protein JRD04_10300, partial [Deltaproteobacteria bacterium]|nr:hypothetical protein [Deltaproteobacteria bacterium]